MSSHCGESQIVNHLCEREHKGELIKTGGFIYLCIAVGKKGRTEGEREGETEERIKRRREGLVRSNLRPVFPKSHNSSVYINADGPT